jgi:oligo-1,6-glucosidase
MTNVRFATLADYCDIETINFHQDAVQAGLSHEEILSSIYSKSRDNARTPMQWCADQPHAGFTNGAKHATPWIEVNENFSQINVEQALADPQSIFYYYQMLIELRRSLPIIVYGQYDILHENDPHIFMYRRSDEKRGQELIVACNFSQQPVQIEDNALANRLMQHGTLLISNCDQSEKVNWLAFHPYETWTLQMS